MEGHEIIKKYLIDNGYTGMTDSDSCTCDIEEICGNCLWCEPYKEESSEE